MPQKSKPAKAADTSVRFLTPTEYPEVLSKREPGTYAPEIKLAIAHPLGTYWVEHHGAGHHAAYFLPRRARSRAGAKSVGGASSVTGALRRISDHEDELVSPDSPREDGRQGPVNVLSLGRRTSGKKTPTQLDAEIAAFLAAHPA